MIIRRCRGLALLAALLLAGLLLSAAACGDSESTTTTVAVQTTTTAAQTLEEAGVGTSGNAIVKGLVDNPMALTANELEAMPMAEITVDHPKLGMTDYQGVLLSELLTDLGVRSDAATVVMTASDGYMAEVSLSDIAASTDAMVTVGEDGTLGVVIPGMESKAWVKDVVSLDFR